MVQPYQRFSRAQSTRKKSTETANAPELIKLKPDSLAYALVAAAEVHSKVLSGVALPSVLQACFAQSQELNAARGLIQSIAYRDMRLAARSDALIQLMVDKKPELGVLHGLLCCALAHLQVDENNPREYEDFVVVDQAVQAAASHANMVYAKGMVNAVLRRFLRERDVLLAQAKKQANAAWNYPQWWIDQCKSIYPNQWREILTAADTPPPLVLRVNSRKISTEAYLRSLLDQGIEAKIIGEFAIRLEKPISVQLIPGFWDGLVSVQDAAAQLAAKILKLSDGDSVLDACAAPGGKTGHILEVANVDVTALDIDGVRLNKVKENIERLNLSAKLVTGDASKSDWWDGKLYDAILADVPCTASGVVRRHPDSRWLRRKTDAAQLAELSSKILDNLWSMLKPGGQLLLVTCSIWPVESELQAQAFQKRHQAIRHDAPGQLLPTKQISSDQLNEHDGLFYALFEKPRVQ